MRRAPFCNASLIAWRRAARANVKSAPRARHRSAQCGASVERHCQIGPRMPCAGLHTAHNPR
ncbi:hypothetical protein C6P74_23845 [Burkholderia multivorans]|nr:hypothetical protein C6P74_23845 [Burkholderia multivorans]PRE82516.1 hypothetical protein C6Q02_17810 [Burkholderia multivorans]